MNRSIVTFLSVALLVFLFYPGTGFAQHFAKYANDFTSIGPGPRALGMGSAYVAVAEGNIAAYWNPAGLARLSFPELHLMYAERFGGIVKNNFAVFAAPVSGDRGFAFSLMRLAVDDIYATALLNPDLPVGAIFEDENGNLVRNTPYIRDRFKDVEYVAFLSYSKKWGNRGWLGGNVKFIHKAVGANSAWGLGFDFSLLMPLYGNLRFGANLQDATSTLIAWDTGNKELASPNLKVGVAYPFGWRKFQLLTALDLDTRFEGREFASQANMGPISFDLHAGLEAAYHNIAFLRFGYDRGEFAAGAGLQLPQLRFDAAFLTHQTLGDTYRISLTISIEKEER